MRLLIVLSGVLVLPATARAQPGDPPVVQIRTAAGLSNFLHGDIGGIAPSMRVAVRIGTGRFAIEPEFGLTWLEETDMFSGTSRIQTTRFQGFGLNAVGRWPGTRVSPYVAVGLGAYLHRRRSETTTADGRRFSSVFDSPGATGAQMMGGLDVRLASRVSAFGEMRYEIQSFADPGGGSVVQGFGGVAVKLW
jgi:hypothetical protein